MTEAFDPDLGHDAGYIEVKKREIVILVDRSGSMAMNDTAQETEAGIAIFLEKQKDVPGEETTVTLAQFDDEFEIVYENVPLDEVPEYTLIPRGMTALYDSIGNLVGRVRDRHKKMPVPERPDVQLVVATDGHENRSEEWTADAVNKLLTKAQKRPEKRGWDWKVTYLGANQDAIVEAGKIGVKAHSSITYDSRVGTRSVWEAAGEMTSMSASGLRDYGYDKTDRVVSMTGVNMKADDSTEE